MKLIKIIKSINAVMELRKEYSWGPNAGRKVCQEDFMEEITFEAE